VLELTNASARLSVAVMTLVRGVVGLTNQLGRGAAIAADRFADCPAVRPAESP